jgi:succinate-semialdehyde dehydrogenase / glutarate-semialdehyde dehydrogenase
MTLSSANPATGRILRIHGEMTDADLDAAVGRAAAAFGHHRRTSIAERSQRMSRLADVLGRDRQAHARLMTQEMGKTLMSAAQEIDKCVRVCRHYADHAAEYLADEVIATEARESYVRYLPIGPILGVMPYNFPFWQVFRFAVPAIMAGNVALLKHASNVSGCSLSIERVFGEAGLGDGVFSSLLVGSARVPSLIGDRRIAGVSLTGGEAAGVSVAERAGAALKPCLLELGGSDAFIVMPSANLSEAAKTAARARILANGQSCIAAKRFIVESSVYDEFAREMCDAFRALVVGDPMLPETDVGPLATEEGLVRLERQVGAAVVAGARVLVGAKRRVGPGFFYLPTILTDIPRTAAIHLEEVFGPVALLYRAHGIDEAIELANDSPYGLGSSVWTQDPSEQKRFIDEIDAGMTFVNAMVASDPRLPFGGVKRSGFGRELGRHGILAFVNAKTVYLHGPE